VGPILGRLTVTGDFQQLAGCEVVIEAVVEDLAVKRSVIERIEKAVGPQTVIGSNTSAIPISLFQSGEAEKDGVSRLQRSARRPERIIGIHWAEPAHVSPFLEVICGDRTSPRCARCVVNLARKWGKDPSMLKKDVRGFITNRCFYALLREAFYLVEHGYATMEDVDRSLQNDLGYFMALAGPFRWMDLTGIPAYATVIQYLWPDLSNEMVVPPSMKKMIASGARGIANQKGFYKYTARSAKEWEKKFVNFSYEIHKLASRYRDDA
jgi:3-hydroxybutyryl-CoA dehydrogenase